MSATISETGQVKSDTAAAIAEVLPLKGFVLPRELVINEVERQPVAVVLQLLCFGHS